MGPRRQAVLNLRRLLLTALVLGLSVSARAQPVDVWMANQWRLCRIEVDGTGFKVLDDTPGKRCGAPVWSPDGRRIAYDISDNSEDVQLAVIRPDGSQRRLLGAGAIPCWSPDGSLILCRDGGKCVMNSDGTGREILPGFAVSLRWFPHGDRVSSMAGSGLAIFDLATGSERLISTSPYRLQIGYDISSDGSRICYGSARAGLCVATLDDQALDAKQAKVDRLVPDGIGYHASWSPDDKRIVFAWQRHPSDLTQLYLFDTASRGEPTLVPGLDLSRHNGNPNWSPDGKTIVFSMSKPWN